MGVKIKNLLFVFIIALAFIAPLKAFADPTYTVNGTVSKISGNTLTVDVVKMTGSDGKEATGQIWQYTITTKTPKSYAVGDRVSFTVKGGVGIPSSLEKGWGSNSNIGQGSQEEQKNYSSVSPTTKFRLFDLSCPNEEALTCWVSKVYDWAQGAILMLAVGAFVVAGLMYMTSSGDPKRTASAKKIMVGALSGVAVIVLGRFFLVRVIGVPWL